MNIKTYKLKELGEVITGKTPLKKIEENYWKAEVPFVKPNNIKSEVVTNIKEVNEYVSEKGAKTGRIVRKGTILVTCIGIIGKVGIVEFDRCIFNQQINAIIPNEKIVITKYLAYLIHGVRKEMQKQANAAVVPIINKTDFSEIIFSVPNLDYQKKVITAINESEKLIINRQSQLKALNELSQSLFLEMFGDPYYNTKKWPIGKIADMALSTQYGSGATTFAFKF